MRVRRAANYALNRGEFVELLGGTAIEDYATMPPTSPYYGHPVNYEYDPAKAKALLKEAGCLPCKITLAISTSGSGQMQPLPMNELVKSQLEEVGFQVEFKVDGLELADRGRPLRRGEIPGDRRLQRLARAARSGERADQAGLASCTGRRRAPTGDTSTTRRSRSWSARSSTSSTPTSGWRC